jgi:hypothetical protein
MNTLGDHVALVLTWNGMQHIRKRRHMARIVNLHDAVVGSDG